MPRCARNQTGGKHTMLQANSTLCCILGFRKNVSSKPQHAPRCQKPPCGSYDVLFALLLQSSHLFTLKVTLVYSPLHKVYNTLRMPDCDTGTQFPPFQHSSCNIPASFRSIPSFQRATTFLTDSHCPCQVYSSSSPPSTPRRRYFVVTQRNSSGPGHRPRRTW